MDVSGYWGKEKHPRVTKEGLTTMRSAIAGGNIEIMDHRKA